MIRLNLRDGILIVDAVGDPSILVGAHRSYFEMAAGFKRDIPAKRYTLNDPLTMQEVLTDTIQYLKDEALPFAIDDSTQSILKEINDADHSFSAATKAGLKIKQSKSKSLRITGLQRYLKPYQMRSVDHLVRVAYGANFSVPGSGKTTIVYAAFAILRQQGIVEKLVVIGPRSCFMPWEEEYLQCFGHPPPTARLTGSKRVRAAKYFSPEKYDLFLCTYQTASNDVTDLVELCKSNKVFLILDESHNVKKFEGGVWAETVLNLAKFATRRVILSGTPAPNRYEDLWTQMTFLWPGKQMLGSREQYSLRCEDKEQWPSIQNAIRPFFVRIRKTELGLPPQRFKRIEVPMNPYQANIYKALSERILSDLSLMPDDRRKLREWRKAKMVRLLQAASNPTLLAKRSEEFDVPPMSGEGVSVLKLLENYPDYETPAKFEAVTKLVSNLTQDGHKVLVWTSFVLNIQMLQNLLHLLDPLILHGAVPKDEAENEELNREQQIREFRTNKNRLLLLANPAACAESISLHKACHHAIYLDRTFDCGRYLQSLDRIHRIGLAPNEEVFYYILKCADTIDEPVDTRLLEKELAMNELLEDRDIRLGTFDVPEHDMSASEDEERDDFEATIADLKRHSA